MAESHSNSSSHNALGSRDREAKEGSRDDRESSTQLHAEAPRGRVVSDVVAEIPHDVVAVCKREQVIVVS